MIRTRVHSIGIATLGIVLVALSTGCSAPGKFVEAPTAIPTLVPATLPPTPEDVALSGSTPVRLPEGFPSAARGHDVYHANCAGCHGEDGTALVPNSRNFTDVEYMRGETPVRFFQIISDGVNADMPGFAGSLSDQERWDVVFYVMSLALDEATLASGKDIYNDSCASCHGDDGTGAIDAAPDFTAPQLTVATAPRDHFRVVTEGEGTMPAWQALLSDDERWAVVSYLLTFGYEPSGE